MCNIVGVTPSEGFHRRAAAEAMVGAISSITDELAYNLAYKFW